MQGIAAAEVVAWLRDRPTAVSAYTEKLAEWIAAHPIQPSAAITQKALSALNRIARSPSELPLFGRRDPEWIAAMSDLRTRLSSETRHLRIRRLTTHSSEQRLAFGSLVHSELYFASLGR